MGRSKGVQCTKFEEIHWCQHTTSCVFSSGQPDQLRFGLFPGPLRTRVFMFLVQHLRLGSSSPSSVTIQPRSVSFWWEGYIDMMKTTKSILEFRLPGRSVEPDEHWVLNCQSLGQCITCLSDQCRIWTLQNGRTCVACLFFCFPFIHTIHTDDHYIFSWTYRTASYNDPPNPS